MIPKLFLICSLLAIVLLFNACVSGGSEDGQQNQAAPASNANQENINAANQNANESVRLETQIPAPAPEPAIPQNAIAVVTISKDGEVSLNAQPLGKDLDRMDKKLRPLLDYLFKDTPKQDRVVYIRADRALLYSQMVKAIDAVKSAGHFTINLKLEDLQ